MILHVKHRVETSSFTVEFHVHHTAETWREFLMAVARAGALVEEVASHTFKLTCFKRKQLQHVGYILYRVGCPRLCEVVSVSGEAQSNATAYARHV